MRLVGALWRRDGTGPPSGGLVSVLPRTRRCSPEGKALFSRGQGSVLPRAMFCSPEGYVLSV